MLNNRNTAHGNQDMIAYAAGLFDGEGVLTMLNTNVINQMVKLI
jgi:hypothetical protein